MDKKQKHREWAHLQRFRKNRDTFLTVKDEDISCDERPDFLITTASGILGIEHTEYLQQAQSRKGSRLLALEVAEDKLITRARNEYEKIGMPPVDVGISFRLQPRPGRVRPSDIQQAYDEHKSQEIVSAIVRIVANNVPSVGKTIAVHHPNPGWRVLPSEVNAIFVSRWNFTTKNSWNPMRGGIIPSLDSEDLQVIVDRKERELPTYKKRCNKIWLLIVSHGFSPASASEIREEVTNHVFKTGFDRIFYMNYFESKVLELETSV